MVSDRGGDRWCGRGVVAPVLTAMLGLLFTTVTVLTVTLWLTDPGYTDTTPFFDLGFFVLGGVITVGSATQIRSPERHVAGLLASLKTNRGTIPARTAGIAR